VSYSRPVVYAYVPNFVSIGLFCRPVAVKRTQFYRFFAVFWTSAFSDVANCHQSQQVQHGAQLQTFPYPTASKSFLYSNTFMAKSGAQSLTFKSETNKQTDKQTDKQTKKTQRFWPPRRRVKSEPNQTWHGDRGPRARSCTSKTFGGLMHSFAARGAENLGASRPPQLETPITP